MYEIQWCYFINIKSESIKISILGMFVLIEYQSEGSLNSEHIFKSLEQMHITWNMDGSANEKSSYLSLLKIVGKCS